MISMLTVPSSGIIAGSHSQSFSAFVCESSSVLELTARLSFPPTLMLLLHNEVYESIFPYIIGGGLTTKLAGLYLNQLWMGDWYSNWPLGC